MTEASYTAWDGNLYEWPPPEGWYQAADGKWWPEGYGPTEGADGDALDDDDLVAQLLADDGPGQAPRERRIYQEDELPNIDDVFGGVDIFADDKRGDDESDSDAVEPPSLDDLFADPADDADTDRESNRSAIDADSASLAESGLDLGGDRGALGSPSRDSAHDFDSHDVDSGAPVGRDDFEPMVEHGYNDEVGGGPGFDRGDNHESRDEHGHSHPGHDEFGGLVGVDGLGGDESLALQGPGGFDESSYDGGNGSRGDDGFVGADQGPSLFDDDHGRRNGGPSSGPSIFDSEPGGIEADPAAFRHEGLPFDDGPDGAGDGTPRRDETLMLPVVQPQTKVDDREPISARPDGLDASSLGDGYDGGHYHGGETDLDGHSDHMRGPDQGSDDAGSAPDAGDGYVPDSRAVELEQERPIWPVAVGGVAVALMVALLVAYGVSRFSGGDTAAAELAPPDTETTGPGSFNEPYEFGTGVVVFYDDDTAGGERRWVVQVLSPVAAATDDVAQPDGGELPENEVLAVSRVRVTYQSGPGAGTVSDLQLHAVGSSLSVYSQEANGCAGLADALPSTATLDPATFVEGNLCWQVANVDLTDLRLGVEAGPADGRVHLSLSS